MTGKSDWYRPVQADTTIAATSPLTARNAVRKRIVFIVSLKWNRPRLADTRRRIIAASEAGLVTLMRHRDPSCESGHPLNLDSRCSISENRQSDGLPPNEARVVRACPDGSRLVDVGVRAGRWQLVRHCERSQRCSRPGLGLDG